MPCRQSLDTLISLLGYNPARKKRGETGWAAGTGMPDIMFGYLKHLWSSSSKDASIDAYQRWSSDCLCIGSIFHDCLWFTPGPNQVGVSGRQDIPSMSPSI